MHLHLVLCFDLFNTFLFVFSFIYFVFHIKIKIKKNQKNSVFCVHSICVPWMAIEIKFSKLCIFCSLDEHIYA